VDRFLPFLATTEILTLATQSGIGREAAHAIIKKYSVAEALKMRKTGSPENNLAESLSTDPVFAEKGITAEIITGILSDKKHFIGNAYKQIESVISDAKRLIRRYEQEARYEPQEIL
jgi:adenylosuccinate lyase